MNRRDFLRSAAVSTAYISGVAGLFGGCADPGVAEGRAVRAGSLYRPPRVSPEGLILTSRPGVATIAEGARSPILTWGDDGPVGPTIEARSGERATILLENQLPHPTIAHWHGLRPPENADGHPRFAISKGSTYSYDFLIDEPAGLYWYHPHPHMDTARQSYLGLVGLFVVRDSHEERLALPSGDHELLLVLQDKRQNASGALRFGVTGHESMEGLLGDAGFVNGVRFPKVEAETAHYRLRILNGSTSRIFRLGRSDGRPLVLIGGDGGFIETPSVLPWIDMGVGERADVLLDLSDVPVGRSVVLKSLPFTIAGGGMGMMGRGMMGMGGGGVPQGSELDLLEFEIVQSVRASIQIPERLAAIGRIERSAADRGRTFRFDSRMMRHTINGRGFAVDRIDERVPFGSTEVWTFVNDSPFPHPVHMHAVHFQVLSRAGGRGAVMPWEQGWKDTVLVLPGERVEVISTFDRHRGLFLLHCHNMVHEDGGMMMNFTIE